MTLGDSALRSKLFPATLESASEAAHWLAEETAGLGLTADVQFAMALCLEEVFANIALHGRATSVGLSLAVAPDAVRLEIIDDGLAFDPTRAPVKRIQGPLAEREIGGLGIGLLHRFAGPMTYRRDAGRNHLTLEFARRSGRGEADS